MRGELNMSIPLVERLRNWSTPSSSEDDRDLEGALQEHWTSVCETLYYLVGDWEEAQDLALETFWRLHTKPPQDHSDPSRLGAWLYRVATNLGLNAIRADRRRKRYEEAAGALRLQRAEPVDPAEEVERREIRDRVRHVLSHMKVRKAQLLILRHTGHSYAEIADVLGVASNSVGTMLARAEKDFERRYRALEDVP
jgi:RNA polymerase sigma-70 factor (ECF subfamily)